MERSATGALPTPACTLVKTMAQHSAEAMRFPWTVASLGTFHKEFANPSALCPIYNRLPFGIPEVRAHSMPKKQPDDLALAISGDRIATPSTAGIPYRQVKRRGSGPIANPRIGTGVEKARDGLGTTGADGPMQRRRPILVPGIHIGSRLQQQANHLDLLPRIPVRAGRTTIGGIMERLAATAIPGRTAVRAGRDQHGRNLGAITRRRDVKGGITDVDPVRDPGFVMVPQGTLRDQNRVARD